MILKGLVLLSVLQAPAAKPAAPQGKQGPEARPEAKQPDAPSGVQYDSNGWPLVTEPVRRAAVPEVRREPADLARPGGETVMVSSPGDASAQLGDVFQVIRSPGAFRSLGGVHVCWQLTVYGPKGETIGTRELTHRADLNQMERDRLEYGDRVFGCAGGVVFAARGPVPWPTLQESAVHELRFYGMLLRAPWLFADSSAFAVVGRDQVQRSGERLTRLKIERRPDTRSELFGPESQPKPRDRFELLCDAAMQPRELVYQFASSGQSRRMLLEDWREVAGVRLSHRRILVDGEGRQTTEIVIKSIDPGQVVNDRDFRPR